MSTTTKHVCNKDNQYYRYAVKHKMMLIAVIPKNHCVFCGSERN